MFSFLHSNRDSMVFFYRSFQFSVRETLSTNEKIKVITVMKGFFFCFNVFHNQHHPKQPPFTLICRDNKRKSSSFCTWIEWKLQFSHPLAFKWLDDINSDRGKHSNWGELMDYYYSNPSAPQTDCYKLELDESERLVKGNRKPQENKRCLRVLDAEPPAPTCWKCVGGRSGVALGVELVRPGGRREAERRFSHRAVGTPSLNHIIATALRSETWDYNQFIGFKWFDPAWVWVQG